jgi:hypothetical protein
MNDSVRTISLDDLGDMQGQSPSAQGQHGLQYSPRYRQTESPLTRETDATSDFRSSVTSLDNDGRTGSQFGTALTRMTTMFGRFEDQKRVRNYLILGAILIVFGGLYYFSAGDLSLLKPQAELLTEAPIPQPKAPGDSMEALESVPPAATMVPHDPTAEDLVNPYWSLPNPLPKSGDSASRGALSQAQEERWRFSLSHPYTYQRYKVVKDIREARLRGSEYLLLEAMTQPKFWTRMEALFALAELGQEVDVDTVEGAVGNTRRELVVNFFKRFQKAASDAELFVMRQAIRVVDAPTREVILRNLARRRDSIHDLYLVAATYDPNPRIKAWSLGELTAAPVSNDIRERFKRIVTGLEVPEGQPAAGSTPATNPPVIQDLKIEEIPTDVNVEEVYFLNEDAMTKEPEPVAEPVKVEDGFEDLEKDTTTDGEEPTP